MWDKHFIANKYVVHKHLLETNSMTKLKQT